MARAPALLAVAVTIVACGPTKDGVAVAPLRPGPPLMRYEQTRPAMGSFLTIRVVAPESREKKVERALENAFEACDRWEKLLSEWIPDSPVSRINAAAGKEPVAVPREVIVAFRKALAVSEASNGAFDPTFAAVAGLWDVEKARIPSEDERAAARAKVDWRKIRIDEEAGTVFLPEEGMKVGFGGIGQGIGADAAGAEIRDAGFDDFVVDLSGDAYFAGDAGGEPWRIAIQDPRGARGETIASIAVRDEGVETSGDYEKYFVDESGKRWHHVIDPRTAAPSRGLASVTVLAGDATTADGWGTAALAAGLEEGLALLRARKLEAVLVSAPEDGPYVMTVTKGLKGRIDIEKDFAGEIRWVETK